jgi:hypothetical protein
VGIGAEVMSPVAFGLAQIKPKNFEQEVCVVEVEGAVGAEVVVAVGSLHPPNQPGWAQEVVVGADEVVVIVGAGFADCEVDECVVVGSLHPNQPGVLQVDVDVVVIVVVVDPSVVVVSSRQPHHPGVLHVEVLVLLQVVVVVGTVVVVVSVPLLS